MTIEELKDLEANAGRKPWKPHYCGMGHEFVDLETNRGHHYGNPVDIKLACVLRNLAPEILALVEACEDYADGCGEGLIFSALDAFNSALASL